MRLLTTRLALLVSLVLLTAGSADEKAGSGHIGRRMISWFQEGFSIQLYLFSLL
jgi:hypothetical protein